jgi:hypothetical protein
MTGPGDTQQAWTALTTHELYYLLSIGDGQLNDLSRRRLGIGAGPIGSDDMELAGASTLLVRGLAKLGDHTVEPIEGCAVLSWALSTAHTWWEVGVTAGDNADALLVLSNDDVAAAFAPATLGIFQFALLDPGAAAAGAARAFVASVLTTHPSVAVAVRRITVDSEESVGILHEKDRWQLSRSLRDQSSASSAEPEECTGDQARDLVETVLR